MLVQKLRLQRGWSQEQLAELSGLSVRTIQRLERGQVASIESLQSAGRGIRDRLRDPAGSRPWITPASDRVRADEALALRHVRKLKGFYAHLLQYVLIVSGLVVLNLVMSPSNWWVIWVALGWGVGVLAHAMRVFDMVPFLNGEWERREAEKFLGAQALERVGLRAESSKVGGVVRGPATAAGGRAPDRSARSPKAWVAPRCAAGKPAPKAQDSALRRWPPNGGLTKDRDTNEFGAGALKSCHPRLSRPTRRAEVGQAALSRPRPRAARRPVPATPGPPAPRSDRSPPALLRGRR